MAASTTLPLPSGEILLGQHLALFDRRLVERIEAEEARGHDRLQHELHEELTKRPLVQRLDMDRAHRTAVLGERLGGGAALRRDKVADGLAAEVRLAGARRERLIDARAF